MHHMLINKTNKRQNLPNFEIRPVGLGGDGGQGSPPLSLPLIKIPLLQGNVLASPIDPVHSPFGQQKHPSRQILISGIGTGQHFGSRREKSMQKINLFSFFLTYYWFWYTSWTTGS